VETETTAEGRKAVLEREQGPDAVLEVFSEDLFSPVPLAALFPRLQPVEIDLGSGAGQFLVGAAQRYPDRNFLGVERLLGRVRKTRRQAYQLGLLNLRVLRFDIDHALRCLLPANSVRRFHLSFPDPWPKRRHHRRRVVRPEFFEAAHAALQPGGDLWIKTDHEGYFAWICKLVPETRFQLASCCDDEYPSTDFEDLFTAKQLPIYRLRLVKAN
jgi:tRNA (guanine-N7-)-methyltransferase